MENCGRFVNIRFSLSKGLCHEDVTVLGEFCAEVIT